MTIFLDYQLKIHPLMQNQDKLKLIYQATFGPNHFISSKDEKKIYKEMLKEAKNASSDKAYYYEYISSEYVRVHLKNELNLKYLLKAFVASQNTDELNLDILKANLAEYLDSDEYQNYDLKPIHHSSIYNEEYHPHYRLIKAKYLNLLMRVYNLSLFLDSLPKHTITALEGKCGSGKTTIVDNLSANYTILHSDDFFLSESAKTKERLSKVGGNINYELIYDTLSDIKKAWEENKTEVTIKTFSCKTQTYVNKQIELKDKVLIEGVYSYHPYFNHLIDKCAFLYIDEATQTERISKREMKDRFFKEWIPLENTYYDETEILSICDIII